MDLGFLKIITDGIKKTIEAYGSLDEALSKRHKEKLEAEDRAKLEETVKVLKEFSVEGTYEYQLLALTFIPAIREYQSRPTQENWKTVKETVISSMDGLSHLSQTLYNNADIFGSKSFFEPLLESIVQRRAILNRLHTMPEPETREEERTLDEFLNYYSSYMQSFRVANGELRRHIETVLEKKA